jgi:hypothetical protein
MEPHDPDASPAEAQEDEDSSDANEREALRRDARAAVAVTVIAALLIGFLWLISRDAPSAGRDPNLTPLVPVATRVPTPAATPLASTVR